MTAVLRTEGLGHRYGHRVWGLRDCTIEVPRGRVVALVGPNGSGKTTLLNMAAGLLPPSTGCVQVAGMSPEERLDRIGYVAQDAPLWPRLRVADVYHRHGRLGDMTFLILAMDGTDETGNLVFAATTTAILR